MDYRFDLPLFRDRTLLQQALTHRSYVNEHPNTGEHNERLEFLGDAVLNFLSGEILYKRYPHQPEGALTPLRSALVDEKQLANFALLLELGNQLRLGRGAERDGGRHNQNLLSSTFEAVIGAYFLDTGPEIAAVRAYVEPLFTSVLDKWDLLPPTVNAKSCFQEWALATYGENPQYVITDQTGPDHAKEFTAEVRLGGSSYGKGKGRRKQDAEKQAAEDALRNLGLL
ncbi:ribonuclease III [Thermocoleostomius sinensis]|uniref:Ribonuclease 3 n=1 Tax=Thermocoleostomius sinensis A174 TaxID=2016057 RepID=A0A9E8ZDJ4_9CYAN|nr:ribonuclease III [Thermocoleostomius sinensis]WAL59408.1 ribonuclease III [Thermocoleostomius sinensis A174]